MNLKDRITFVCPTVNKAILTKNIKRSKIFKDGVHRFIFKENHPNVRQALNEGFREADTEWVSFIHEDVFMYDEFEAQLTSSLQRITAEQSSSDNIGVLGVAGVTWKTSNNKRTYVGALNDRGHKNWGTVKTSPTLPYIKCETLDELLLIVPNEEWVTLDEKQPSGHHLYGAELCFRANDANKQNYALWAYVLHASETNYSKSNIGAELQAYAQHLKPQFNHHFPFATTCGIFK